MFKKSLYTAFSFFLLVSWVIFAPATLATEIEIYPGSGNATANATSAGWTDNHLVGQTFTIPANVYKINRIRLTNFKLGMAGQNNGGIVQVLLYAGTPAVSQVEVSPGVKTTQITPDPSKLISSVGPVYVAAWKLNHYLADLCTVDHNSTEDYALTELQINDPLRPCPAAWGKGGSTFIRADFDGTNRLRTVFPWGNAYSEGTGWQSDTTLEVPFPNNTVTPGGTYYIAIQQNYMQQSDYIDQGKYNCWGPLSLSTPGDGGGLCGQDQVFVASLSTNNPYGSGQAYFNTFYYSPPGYPPTSGYNPATGDLANFKVWGETTFNNAACSSIAAPATVNSGQTFAASVQMLNTGTTTWTSSSSYRLGSQTPLDNTTWGSNRANLSAEPVAPNTVGAFNFNVAAPSTPGVYDFDWQMVQDGGTPGGWFGDTCRKRVTVVANPVGNFDGGVCTALTGWTCDGDNYDAPLRVDFYADGPAGTGTPLTSADAGLPREAGVGAQCGGKPNHGFSYAIPANALRDGRTHQIYAYGINIGTGTHTLLPGSPKPVTCAAPQLKALQITRGTSADRTAGTYGVSGLNATQGGRGYYNSLQIAQSLNNATPDNVALVGIAFTQNSGSPGAGANLQQLMDHVRTTNGFILLSVNKTTIRNNQPLVIPGLSPVRQGYYIYYRNSTQWQRLPTTIPGVLDAKPITELTQRIKPFFDVELYSGLGSRTWGTYGYLMDSNGNEKSQPENPIAASP